MGEYNRVFQCEGFGFDVEVDPHDGCDHKYKHFECRDEEEVVIVGIITECGLVTYTCDFSLPRVEYLEISVY